MNLNQYFLFWICIIGLCLGSFFNVVILRSLSGESIVFPASKCPKCGHKLYFWHNIPLLSYLFLRGKCYFCHEKISLQYPIIELVTMVLFALTFLKFGLNMKMFFILCWISCLLIMTATDLKEKIVDCNIAIIMAITGAIYNTISYGWNGLWTSILGLIAGAFIIELFARIGYLFSKTRAMGEADTYVAGALGAVFTINGILPVIMYSFAASMLFVVPIFAYNKLKNKDFLLCSFLFLFILSIIVFKMFLQNIYSYLFLVITGICLAVLVIKNIRNAEKLNYIPFVPAFSVGALIGFCTLLS